MKKIVELFIIIKKKIYLATKILFTLNIIESKNIQGNNIILILPRKVDRANFIKLILDEKKLLHASQYYIRKPQKKPKATQLIIKTPDPNTKKIVFNPNTNTNQTNTINNTHGIQQKTNTKPENITAEQVFTEYLSKNNLKFK